jgi:hypothetical protein
MLLLVHPTHAQSTSAQAEGANANGGYIRDSRQHPSEPSRNNAFP